MDGLVGGFGSGDRTFARRTCLADIVPDTPAAAAGIDPRARGTVEASRAADFGACGGTFFTRVDRQFVQRRTRFPEHVFRQSRASHTAPSLGCVVRVGRESERGSVGGSFEARHARLGVGVRRDVHIEHGVS